MLPKIYRGPPTSPVLARRGGDSARFPELILLPQQGLLPGQPRKRLRIHFYADPIFSRPRLTLLGQEASSSVELLNIKGHGPGSRAL